MVARVVAPFPFPFLHVTGFRLQAFANAGNLLPFTARTRTLFTDTRLSLGVGIMLGLGGVARIEANYAVPIRKKEGDLEQRWQIGLAANL